MKKLIFTFFVLMCILGMNGAQAQCMDSVPTGQTLTGDSVTMTYTATGVDSLTIVATNAYDSDTAVNTVQALDCQEPISAFPWMVDFSTEYDCWHTVGRDGWSVNTNSNGKIGIVAGGEVHRTIASPAVALPTDSTGLRLYWKDCRWNGSNATYYVMVSTTDRLDLEAYDTIFTSTSQSDNLTQRSVSLADYAGDTVYIAFRRKAGNWWDNNTTYITDVAIYNALVPMGTLEVPVLVVAGDTARYTLYLTQGDSVSYSWYSSLMDSTIVTADSMLAIVYPIAGSETLTAMASNAHGTLVLTACFEVFGCDTIREFPWNEDFVETGSAAIYNYCWEISGYYYMPDYCYYGFDEEDGSPRGEARQDFMMSYTQGDYMLTPPIAVPAVIEKNLSLWVEHFDCLMAVVETEEGNADTVYALGSYSMTMRRRPIALAPYAGQTIRVRLNNFTNSTHPSVVDRIRVDYDTVSVVVLSAQQKTTTDSATLIVATQLRGFVPGLNYSWQSQVGGTFVTNATGDSAWVTYSTGITGVNDTVSVTATNSYGSYTARHAIHVIDCLPVDTLPWVETFTDGIPCWYKPAGSNWAAASHYGYEPKCILSSSGSDNLAHWVMSKAITLPADTSLCTRLFWDVAASNITVHHNYGVWVTTSEDFTDTLNYTLLYHDTNTHTNFTNFDHLSTPLTAYAGQTIHVAFRNIRQQSSVYIDNVIIRTTAEPEVSIEAPAELFIIDPVDTAVAVLVEGSSTGLTYAWHSTMLGNGVGSRFPLSYTTDGIDTLTLVATNAYGNDTATMFITVRDCPAINAFPYKENFNTSADLSCWRNWNFGSYNITPFTWNQTYQASHQAMGSASTGSLSHFNSWLVSPAIAIPEYADGLNLDLDVYGSYTSIGDRNYVSYLDILVSSTGGANTSHFIDTLSHDFYIDSWKHVHLPLAAYAGQTINIAFVNNTNNDNYSRHKGVWIDDLSIGYKYLPEANFTYTAAMMGDTVSYTATTGNCVSTGLSYTWHSSLMDSTFSGETINVVYETAGNDTMQLIVANVYGADTVSKKNTIGSYPLPQASLPNFGSLLAFDTTYVNATVNGCSQRNIVHTWHSTMAADGQAQMSTDANQAILYYTADGTDTITYIVSNHYGADTATAIYRIYNCNGMSLPYFEDFESVSATDYYIAGSLPPCWSRNWTGSNANFAPHVIPTNGYSYLGTLPSKALLMTASSSTLGGYANQTDVILPRFTENLQSLLLAFDYRYESPYKGTLKVGYYDTSDTFVTIKTMPAHTSGYRRDTISFDTASVPDAQIVLQWNHDNEYYSVAVAIDNIEVYYNNGIPATEMLTVENVTATCATFRWSEVDTATAYRITLGGAMQLDTVLTDTTLTLCDLMEDADYTVWVAPMVGDDVGWSVSSSFHTIMLCAPLANVSISPEGIISWQYDTLAAEQIPDGVEIEIIDQQGMVLVQTDIAYFSPYVPADLIPGHTYSFAVRTRCSNTTAHTADTVVMQVTPSVCAEAASNIIPSNSHFMDNFWENNYSQVIYPSSFAAGIDTLYGIALRVAQYTWQNSSGSCLYDIYVGQTNGTHTSPLTSDSLTMVMNNKHYSLSGTGWKNFLFDTPYLYDGTGDLVVTIVGRQAITGFKPVYGVHTDFTCTHFVQEEDYCCAVINPSTFNFQWETNANIPDIRLLGGCGGSLNSCLAPEVEVTAVDTHSVSLQWQQRGSESFWQVEYRSVDSAAWQLADTTSATSFIITGLAQATHYVVRVGSVCSDNLVVYGSPVTATPAPDTVWRTVTVTTDAPGACQPYGSGVYPDSSMVEIGYMIVDTATAGGHWQFLGWSDGGSGNPRNILLTSDTAIVAQFQWVSDSVGISELRTPDSDFTLYPNPASATVTVIVGTQRAASAGDITIFDLQGREVRTQHAVSLRTDIGVSDLPRGVYFVRIGGSGTVKKLVVR